MENGNAIKTEKRNKKELFFFSQFSAVKRVKHAIHILFTQT